MVDFGEPELTIRFEALGRDVVLNSGYSIDSSYLTPTDGFEFTLYDTDRAKMRGLELQPVNLLIDGHSQCLGRIDMTERGTSGTAITCKGRDYLADMTECHVDPTLQIKKEMTLETALLMSAGVVGINEIVSDDDVTMQEIRTGRKIKKNGKQPKRHKRKLEEYKPNPGESIYAFDNRIVARMGATIQPADARNKLRITSPRYDQAPIATITRLIGDAPAAQNLVISGTATRDFSSFPTYVLVAGKMVSVGVTKVITEGSWTWGPFANPDSKVKSGLVPFPSPFSFDTRTETVQVQKQLDRHADTLALSKVLSPELARILGGVVATARRRPTDPAYAPGVLYRLLYQKDAESGDQDQLDRVAVRAFAQKFKESLSYRVTLRGHVDPTTGSIWSVDTMIRVNDEVCDLDNEILWCMSRRFSFAQGSGATTELELLRPGSFVIDTNEDTV